MVGSLRDITPEIDLFQSSQHSTMRAPLQLPLKPYLYCADTTRNEVRRVIHQRGQVMMQVRDYMTTNVLTINVEKKMCAVQEIMQWAHIRHLPVVDRTKRVVGLVSHRDLLHASISMMASRLAAIEKQQHLWEVPIEPMMHTPVYTIAPDASVQAAARRMRRHQIGCLPVVVQDRLVGIITESDLLHLVEQLP
jgi:CBS domain-containing protein